MITRRVRIQLILFALITAIGITYVGIRYVGISRDFYTVRADLERSGGIFTNAEVNYRGVKVGQVGRLNITDDGVLADLEIEPKWQIPKDTRAIVANRSAVGEQYVDLQPRSEGEPFLEEGSVIPRADTQIPLTATQLLVNLHRLVESVPGDKLGGVVDEVGTAFAGTGTSLQRLIDSGDALVKAATENLPQTISLIRDSEKVLRTQVDQAPEIRTFADQLAKLTDSLRASDPQIRTLLDQGPVATTELTDLLRRTEPTLGVLFGNLLTVGQVLEARIPGIRQVLVMFPMALATGPSTAPGDARGHLGIVIPNYADPPPCTAGYTTKRRDPQDTADTLANRQARCTDPRPEVDVRGSKNSPRGGSGDRGGLAPGASGPFVTSYDPWSGLFAGPGGGMYTVGVDTGEARRFSSNVWEQLLLFPILR